MTGLRRRIGWGAERGQVLVLTGAVLIALYFLRDQIQNLFSKAGSSITG